MTEKSPTKSEEMSEWIQIYPQILVIFCDFCLSTRYGFFPFDLSEVFPLFIPNLPPRKLSDDCKNWKVLHKEREKTYVVQLYIYGGRIEESSAEL